MAEQMPIPQDYDRHISSTEDTVDENDSIYEILDKISDVEELPDGSAIIRLEELKTPAPFQMLAQ